MLRQFQVAFSSPKFVVGFCVFVTIVAAALIYPYISPVGPIQMVSRQAFIPPGRYVNIQDVVESRERRQLLFDVETNRLAHVLTPRDAERMVNFLVAHHGFNPGSLDVNDKESLIHAWNANYDPGNRIAGMTLAAHNENVRFHQRLQSVLCEDGVILAVRGEDGSLVEDTANAIHTQYFVNVNSIINVHFFPLGTDNFGRDVLTQLLSAVLVSLRLGIIAGIVATIIGLTLGLVSGYVGGMVDNAILFITNIFTVVPGFVLLILISHSLSPGARTVGTVAVVIGFTAWPWTCRSVRSQVLSLRNRDHVNLSMLSGHSIPRIILRDILPYVASYVVMAFILQISSAILAEATLSILGLGPNTAAGATLGLMMHWSVLFSAWQLGAWWAFVPVILTIALISFSLNLMNTGLDQIFNPQLRKG
ncbi:MAG: ABC transporter permease [Treponema sp.]|nr:ABC transporter permease [Treponema sp.]